MIFIYIKHIVFKETALALYYTLRELNYNVELTDMIDDKDTNLYIILGGHNYLGRLPKNYIIYQLEQTNIYITDNETNKKQEILFSDRYVTILKQSQSIWDYSKSNIKYIKNHYGIKHIYWVPLYYTKYIENIKITNEKPIDILFYGSMNTRRQHILEQLKLHFNVAIYINNLWDVERDDLISKSKIILNIHYYENAILEIHRISYLLSNKCLVITEQGRDSNEFSKILISAKYNQLIKTCQTWLSKSDLERKQMALYSYREFKQHFKLQDYLSKQIIPELPSNTSFTNKKKHKIDYYIPTTIDKVESTNDNGSIILKLPPIDNIDLPDISIITPTANRRQLFTMAVRNFLSFIYPKNKMEWVILDDGEQDLTEILPYNDSRIKYIRLSDRNLTVARKRNLCVEHSSHDIIVSMDDDDYYPPESLLARVKTLLKYPDKNCVGCSEIGCYNLLTKISSIASDGLQTFTEASMAFRKSFWLHRPFLDENKKGEGKYFLQYRQKELVNIPFQFVIIALNHGNNLSGQLRLVNNFELWYQTNKKDYYDLFEYLEEDTQIFLQELTKLIQQ